MGLISKDVEVVANAATMKYYEEDLGYEIPKHKDRYGKLVVKRGTKIKVKTDDLLPRSKVLVEVECDFCKEHSFVTYNNYLNKTKTNVLNEYVCKKCKKIDEVKKLYAEEKFKRGILKKGVNGYYSAKENRLKELQNWIDEYGHINLQINKKGNALYANLIKYNEKPHEMAAELGYNIYDLMKKKPVGWYYDFSVVEDKINQFINENGYFPTIDQSGINSHAITRHGGMYEIKRKMNYDDKKDLKDNSGFYNMSKYELWTANYLLANNINYKRETKPFKGKKYRADFELQILNTDKTIRKVFVEVWGYEEDNTTQNGAVRYNETKKIKKDLYDKYGYELISIEPSTFKRKTFDEIENNLYNIFSGFLDLKYKFVDKNIVFPLEMTDEDLFTEIMKYSTDKNTMPLVREVSLNNHKIYMEVINRYNTFDEFAEVFGVKTTKHRNNYWNKNTIFDEFDYMIEKYDKLIYAYSKEFEFYRKTDNRLNINVKNKMSEYGGSTNVRLEYYNHCLDNNKTIPQNEIDFMNYIVNYNLAKVRKITTEQQTQAQEILDILSTNGLIQEAS